ncbi:CopD family protein [uncultured Metabacillus sp.]|uniref:copper resistance D family protein n=1 Tax=uncultured Metabacillus sp. TaxID=2860135 RepID=UPI00260286F7|nr:CopD family protein [uncultured Metabacillus sp.]
MTPLIPITEYITYMLFSYLTGHVILQFIPVDKKPAIQVSKSSLLLSVLGIIIFTFFPVLQVISYFSTEGFLSLRAYAILTEFQVGISWLYGSFFAVFLWMVMYVEGSKYLQAFFLFLMMISLGYASHSASLDLVPGLFSHSIHFLTITIWVGVLIHIGWLAKSIEDWHGFLRWFTPLSIVLFLITTVTGILLMFFVFHPRDYANAWVLPYGQMLLLKHLSIIPVLMFALVNGILSRKAKVDSTFDAKKWIQAETVILMIIFFITGVLGTLTPPHQVNATVIQEGAAFWVEYFIGHKIAAPFIVQLNTGFEGIVLLCIAILFLALIVISFYKKVSAWIPLSFGILFIISAYLGLMMSVSIG